MEAERAWSYAMQLKQEANTEPRKRFHLLARLRKAAKHSEKLEKLCESPRVDAKTKLEAQVPSAHYKYNKNREQQMYNINTCNMQIRVFAALYCVFDKQTAAVCAVVSYKYAINDMNCPFMSVNRSVT